jgi:valyl-tRNA synthetase
MIKPEFGKPIDEPTYTQTIAFFEKLLKALHPIMPFITEELWHELREREDSDCIIVADWPTASSPDDAMLAEGHLAFEIITEIRNCRSANGISPKDALELYIKADNPTLAKSFWPVIQKLSNLSAIALTKEKLDNATSFMVGAAELSIPMVKKIDITKMREGILKDLEYQRGFMDAVEKKLSNERFVKSAPANVIALERKKKEDAESKIKALEESLSRL